MTYSIRTDRTNTRAHHVQVVRYALRKPIIVKHIGTAHTEEEAEELRESAKKWILENPPPPELFPKASAPILLSECEYHGSHFTFACEFLHKICEHFQFTIPSILADLVIMRIFEPASKRRSLELLEKYFAKVYTQKTLYYALATFPAMKDSIEEKLVAVAQSELGFDFSFVLYDVTTLYFESFTQDEEKEGLRKTGFSKDSKSQQPQIVVGLMVTPEGFPVSYEVFAGNTFEGHTFLPSILAFKKRHKVETLTIVADAGMLSRSNMVKLAENGLTYIVGARLGNISEELFSAVTSGIIREDGATMRADSPLGTLICAYSQKRYTKDLSDMNKQIKKAEVQIQTPSKVKRAKFVSAADGKVSLNDDLIEKTKKLLGVKGYYTNLPDASDDDIIRHYKSLWHVEQAFRVAKSDLATRPVFHRKKDSVKAHLLICVMALAVSKYIEIRTKRSLRSVLDALRSVTDGIMVHTKTGEVITMRSPISDVVREIEKEVSH